MKIIFYKWKFNSNYFLYYENYANNPNKIEPRINIIAPPILDEICANDIKSILLAAPRTATSPAPPLLDIHNPAVIAASIG